ncbi:MAG: YgeY family selenium metabolism-linked hydrolase [Calditrichia bacterium]|nr:YgeY family selenium metabolism-linked hydrolase [Calditrichia bacterium]
MNYNRIDELANTYTEKSAKFLRDIIAIPSTSCNEGPVIERIAQEMNDVGFDEIIIDPMGNVLGRIGDGKHIIAMDGHVDTVGVGNPANWKHDPFKGKVENGVIYGRGASDMKGAMAAMVYAGKIIKEMQLEDDYTLYVSGTVQEEDCDGLCWQYIIKENKIVPEVVVIAEPTNLQIYRGQRGRMEFEVVTEGISAHGAAPERGVNAIYKISPIIREIEQLNDRLATDEFLGKGSITISRIRSGSPSLNAVADMAAIYIDRRLTAGETLETAKEEIASLPSFKDAEAKIVIPEYNEPSYKGLIYNMQKYYATWTLEKNHPVLKTAVGLYEKVFGKQVIPGKWGFSTNGVSTAGIFNIPTFGFGPANEIYAHTVDDQCPINHLTEAMKFYAAFSKYYVHNNVGAGLRARPFIW